MRLSTCDGTCRHILLKPSPKCALHHGLLLSQTDKSQRSITTQTHIFYDSTEYNMNDWSVKCMQWNRSCVRISTLTCLAALSVVHRGEECATHRRKMPGNATVHSGKCQYQKMTVLSTQACFVLVFHCSLSVSVPYLVCLFVCLYVFATEIFRLSHTLRAYT